MKPVKSTTFTAEYLSATFEVVELSGIVHPLNIKHDNVTITVMYFCTDWLLICFFTKAYRSRSNGKC